MFYDISQLHAVSIWMTMDKGSFVFLLKSEEIKKLLDIGNPQSLMNLVQHCILELGVVQIILKFIIKLSYSISFFHN